MYNIARATERTDQPPSTSGTSLRRARRWPLRVGLLALGVIAVAAPMVAAEPASAPVRAPAAAAPPARAILAQAPGDQEPGVFAGLGDITYVSAAVTAQAATGIEVAPPPPPPTTTTTAPPTTTTTAAPAPVAVPAPAPSPAPAPAPATGRCGGDLPPCWVMERESGGSLTAQNPTSSASGKWQFIRSTWAGYGGYAEAHLAPESVQDAKARGLWAGGAGCGHWSAC